MKNERQIGQKGLGSEPFPTDIVWNLWILMRGGFFGWEAIWGKIFTMDHLKGEVCLQGTDVTFVKGKEVFVDGVRLDESSTKTRIKNTCV